MSHRIYPRHPAGTDAAAANPDSAATTTNTAANAATPTARPFGAATPAARPSGAARPFGAARPSGAARTVDSAPHRASRRRNCTVLGVIAALLVGVLNPTGTAVAAGGPASPGTPVTPPTVTAVEPEAPDAFYSIPATLPAAPGSLIKAIPTTPYIYKTPTAIIPASAQRIMYRSTSVGDTPTVITGTTLLPKLPWAGRGTRPVVVVGPGTHGMGTQCAPSNEIRQGLENEAPLYAALVMAGYAVVITDYEGLGTGLPNTYMAREAQGHAILDAGRAALASGLTGITARSPLLLLGYSQGGAAVASAAELASTYAPELNIIGGFAGGVPADLVATAKFVDQGTNPSLLFDAALSMGWIGHVDVERYLNARGVTGLAFSATHCLPADNEYFADSTSSEYTVDGTSITTLLDTGGPLAETVAAQKLGNGTPSFPMLVGHSPADDTIPGGPARTMVQQWCSRGAAVDLEVTAPLGHVDAYISLLPNVLSYFTARTWGTAPSNNCSALPPLS